MWKWMIKMHSEWFDLNYLGSPMKIFVVLILGVWCLPLHSETLTDVNITLLMMDKNHSGKVFIKTSKSRTANAPACHTSDWSFVMSYSDEMDKAIYSALLAAHLSGRTLNLYGSGSCVLRPDAETLIRFEMK